VGDLLRRQPVVQAETRHVGARREGVGVVDLVVGVLDDLVRVAAQLAEMMQAGADGAVGDFLLGQLVAGVAVAATRTPGRVGLDEADVAAGADCGELLAFLPVADQLAVDRVADGRGVQPSPASRRSCAAGCRGTGCRFSSSRPARGGSSSIWIVGAEGAAEHLLGFLGVFAAGASTAFWAWAGGQGLGQPAKKGKFQFHGRPLFQRLMPGVSITVPVAVFCR
jgi:hypothetical protein